MLLIICTRANADNTFPYSYTSEIYDGGKLISIQNPITSSYTTFFIKPNWAGESEIIYSWKGIERYAANGFSYGDIYIMDAISYNQYILLVWSEGAKVYLVSLDTNAQIKSKIELAVQWQAGEPRTASWIDSSKAGDFLLIAGKFLYNCHIDSSGIPNAELAAKNVSEACYLNNINQQNNICIISSLQDKLVVNFTENNGQNRPSVFIPYSDDLYTFNINGDLAIISSKSKGNSILQIINENRGIISSLWLETKVNLAKIFKFKDEYFISCLKNKSGKYSLSICKLKDSQEQSKWANYEVSNDFIEPIELAVSNDNIFVLFRNGLLSYDLNGTLISSDFMHLGEIFSEAPGLYLTGDYLILSTKTTSAILTQTNHPFWFLNKFYSNLGKLLIPLILAIMFLIVFQLYRHEKRFLRAVLNLPSSSIVFVLDKRGRLILANSSGRLLLGINASIPMKKPFQFYCSYEHTKPIKELVYDLLSNRTTASQNITITRDSESKELFCNITPMTNLTGQFRGMVFTGIDITEELGRKQLSNWAQLAHDMQTNLSTIRLNAELLEVGGDTENIDRREKILHQAGLLIHRVRDIVTVGRGDKIIKLLENSITICNEARSEFDYSLFPNVEIQTDLKDFNFLCDKPKIVRALRNAIENSIRALQGESGFIKLSCWIDGRYAYFGVRDNGCGMDEKTKNKMLAPYFTTSKKEGGTGIGTMIMQHVAELHNGSIKIYSEKGAGTEIIFALPLLKYSKQKRVN